MWFVVSALIYASFLIPFSSSRPRTAPPQDDFRAGVLGGEGHAGGQPAPTLPGVGSVQEREGVKGEPSLARMR